ncbi:MAG TPA: hypothetical protein VGD71_24805 [Kribbella sp.]
MTEVTMYESAGPEVVGDAVDEQLVRQLTERARSEGLQLTGEGGPLGRPRWWMVVGSALEGELDDHLGYGRHDPAGRMTHAGRLQQRGKLAVHNRPAPADATSPPGPEGPVVKGRASIRPGHHALDVDTVPRS